MCGTERGWGGASGWVGEQSASARFGSAKAAPWREAARAVRISGELSALLALLIWANEAREWQGARTRTRIIRISASGAYCGGDTTQEAQQAGLDGHWVASWEGSEGSREEG